MTQQSRRVLGQRTHTALIEHYCDTCEHQIFPGDLYEVTVTLLVNGSYRYMQARKEHVNPACLFPDPDEYETDYTVSFSPEFKLAA